MYNIKALLSLAVLAGMASAQTTTDSAECQSKVNALLAAAPTPPPELNSYFNSAAATLSGAGGLLDAPDAYVTGICSLVTILPSSLRSQFGEYGSSLLHFASVEISSYDEIVTECVTTGPVASSITSYIHSIASEPGRLCQEQTITTTAYHTVNTTSASVTPYPTATSTSNGTIPSSAGSSSTLVPTAGAARVSGVFAGAAAVGGILGAVALL